MHPSETTARRSVASSSSAQANSNVEPASQPYASQSTSTATATNSSALPLSLGEEDPQVLFRTAANAVAQLYRHSTVSTQKAQHRGYLLAIQNVAAALASLESHPLTVHTNGRAFVPLDLALHCVHATGLSADDVLSPAPDANSEFSLHGMESDKLVPRRSPPMSHGSSSALSGNEGFSWNLIEPMRKRARDF